MQAKEVYDVIIVDDHPVVRRGFKQLLQGEPDLNVCGEAADATEAQAGIEELDPDLILLDLSMEGMGGIEFLKQLRSYDEQRAVLIVSMHDEALYAERALQAGAQGYVMKRAPDCVLLTAIRDVLAGHLYVSEELRSRLLPLEVEMVSEADTPPVGRLTDREFEVFTMLGRGYPPREIAAELCVSVKTVESHRQRLKEKLHLDTATQLTRYAVQWHKENGVEG